MVQFKLEAQTELKFYVELVSGILSVQNDFVSVLGLTGLKSMFFMLSNN